ncbi:hypothetical protein [Actinomadura violacea]|uniref:Uncharacterized protein n=1 Tax=Actinomadura violacea TaxID=2819934 RepID=A0ABS3S9A8_9ACTN|nr:hypothetical protein [Actinomadura violacea]MBO2465318.1 hypothetical protein [Actinomadura violacea]
MPEQSPTRFTMVPARRSNEPTARRRARRILAALFLASGLSVVAVVIAASKGGTRPDLSAVDPRGRSLAYTAAVNFLAGTEQNVPHADSFDPERTADQGGGEPVSPLRYRSLSWVGFTPEHFGSKKAGFTDFEVHHFLVALATPATSPSGSPQAPASGSPAPGGGRGSGTGGTNAPQAKATPLPGAPSGSPAATGSPTPAPGAGSASPGPGATGGPAATQAPASDVLQLDVPILLSGKGPRLAAAPAFSVWQDGVGDAAGKGDYTNYGSLSTEVSDAAKNQIVIWARAYASGDSAALLAVTGDQNGSHRYAGLSGFTLPDSPDAVQILSAIKAAGDQLIVRARVRLTRPDPAAGGKGPRPFTTFADFDLLVGAPSGAQPPVLAWGPAGSAAQLEPYQNAIGP